MSLPIGQYDEEGRLTTNIHPSSVPNQDRQHTSYSEINTWTKCRQMWHWSYHRRLEKFGFNETILTGSCGHVALKALFSQEPVSQTVRKWVEDESQKYFGIEEIDEILTGIGDNVLTIIDGYCKEYGINEWEVVLVEQPFAIPLKGLTKKMAGTFDLIIKDHNGKHWLVEHKWPKNLRPQEYIDMDTQIGIYQWAAQRLGINIVGTIYNQLLQTPPKEPALNQNIKGVPGKYVSRSKIRTTWEVYSRCVERAGDDPDLYIDEMAPKLVDFKFYDRYYIYRPATELRNFAQQLEHRVWEMEDPKKHVYMNESWMLCRGCPFRELCIETLKGGDVESLIDASFRVRQEREVSVPVLEGFDDAD
jgi:hypothetical protein